MSPVLILPAFALMMSWSRLLSLCISVAMGGTVVGAACVRNLPPIGPQKQAYRQDVFALCAEEMAGRGTGTAGGERAIAFLVDSMAGIGLRPGVHGSFRSDFGFDDPSPATYLPSTACALLAGNETWQLELGKDGVPFRFSADGKVKAEVIFAGHGLVVAELGVDDYANLDVRGKIVLVLRGAPGWRDPDSRFRGYRSDLTFLNKVTLAQERGAVGLLLVDREEGGREADPQLGLGAPGLGKLPALWLRRNVVAQLFVDGEAGLLTAQRLADGIATTGPKGKQVTADLRPGAQVELYVAMGPRRAQFRSSNVIGLWPGACADVCGEIILVGAHHDHLGHGEFFSLAGEDGVGKVHPGGDDNASGVAGMLELARRWQRRGSGRRTLVFAGFGAEEFGQIGSERFLEQLPIAGSAIVAMIDLDMIGRGRSGVLTVFGTGSGKGFAEVIQQSSKKTGVEVQVRTVASHRTDQSAFLDHGIPALLFTTGLHQQYHRPSDVPELVEVEAANRVLDLVDTILQDLVNGERRAFVPAFTRK